MYILCTISVCNHILFDETASKSNFIPTVLYLRIHMLMHYFTFGFKYTLVYLQHSFEIHYLMDETDN